MKNSINLVVPPNELPDAIKYLGIVACRVYPPKRRGVNVWDSRVVMRSQAGNKSSHLIQITHQAMTENGTEQVIKAVCDTALKLIQTVNSGKVPGGTQGEQQ